MSGGVNWLMFAWIPHYAMGIPQVIFVCLQLFIYNCSFKVEKIFTGSLNSIRSPSFLVKIQIMGAKVCSRCKGKTMLGVVNKLLTTKSLLTSPSNVLPYYLE